MDTCSIEMVSAAYTVKVAHMANRLEHSHKGVQGGIAPLQGALSGPLAH